MAGVIQRSISAEEFARMPDPPDGSKQELIRGVIVTMPPPKAKHGVCCSKIDRRVGTFVENNRRGHVCCNDTGFITERDPDTVREAEIAYWSYDRLPELPDAYPEVAPNLAIEVLSPRDKMVAVLEKLRAYFARGVQLVWIVDPKKRTVTVYRSLQDKRVLRESDILTGGDVLPGFDCKVAELFA